MMQRCLICERISSIQKGTNEYFVAELPSGYVVIGDYQLFEGYTVFLYKRHVHELHELHEQDRMQFLKDMSEVGAAVFRAFAASKMNYDQLGNTDNHLHWHIFPRYEGDAAGKKPIWTIPKTERESVRPSPENLVVLKKKLLAELQRTPGVHTGGPKD